MSKHSAAWALPLDERPPGLVPDAPEQPAPGEAQTTTSEDTASQPPRGGPSLIEQCDAVRIHVQLMLREALEVHSVSELLNVSTGVIVMRVPVADLLLQINALKAVVLDLQRTTGRRAKT